MPDRRVALPGHHFWADEITVAARRPFASRAFIGHRQTTDAYLLALAQQHRGRLVTLEGGLAGLIADRGQRDRWIEWIDPGDRTTSAYPAVRGPLRYR